MSIPAWYWGFKCDNIAISHCCCWWVDISVYCWHGFNIIFSRDIWTWPPWVICAPALKHKIGNAGHSGVSEVLFFTKSHKWKTQRQKKLTTRRLLREAMCFWRSPMALWLSDRSDHNRNSNFQMWSDNVLHIICYFLTAIASLRVS